MGLPDEANEDPENRKPTGQDTSESPSDPRLTSWKEIAAFLGRDPRTVQRWEKTEGLPIHRHRHQKLDSIYAYKSELRRWQESRRTTTTAFDTSPTRVLDSRLAKIAEDREPAGLDAPQKGTSEHSRRRTLKFWVVAAALVGLGAVSIGIRVFRPAPSRSGLSSDYTPLPLSTNQGDEYAPSFSPEGREVAFVWNGEGRDKFKIYTKSVGSQAVTRLTTGTVSESSPAWSPDGRLIAFCQETTAGKSAIFVVPASGGPQKKIVDLNRTPLVSSRDLAWSANGKWLAVAATPSSMQTGAPGLFLVSIDRGGARQVTFPHSQEDDVFPSFSWAGDRLAFTRDVGRGISKNLIVKLDADMRPKGEPERLTTDEGFDAYFSGFPAWTPDDRDVVFSSNRGGQYRLWAASPGSSKARSLGSLGSDIHMPAISKKGQLAFVRNLSHWGVWKIDLEALLAGKVAQPVRAIGSTQQEDSPKVSPDGKKLMFMSTRSGFSEVWESNLDGSDAVALTSIGSVGVGSPAWSPDGKRIAFDSRIGGKPDVYVLDLNGGKPVRITKDAAANMMPFWSRDGQHLYFTSSRSGADNVWRVALDGGPAEQVTKSGAFGATASPDGKTLYYMRSRTEAGELWRMELASFKESPVATGVIKRGFAPTDEGTYFFRGDEHGLPTLCYFRSESGKSRELLKLSSPVLLSPGLSPDGKTLFYGQLDQSGHDLMMVEEFWRPARDR